MEKNNYTKVKLKDIAEIINGGTPSTKNPEYWEGDISWITPKDLSTHSDKYISTGERSITRKGLDNSSAHLIPKNTILFSSRAPIGYIALAGRELSTNQGFKNFVCNEDIVDYNYLYYWLIKNTEKIEKRAMGSTFSEISKTAIGEISISLPPLPEQKRIANILSSFDNKIELLREQNKTLENIAQTIFKQWFIDFNFPDSNGKPYKDNGGEMIDSELGEIPEGWEVGRLNSLSKHCKETIKPSLEPETKFHLYSIPAYDNQKLTPKTLGKDIKSTKYVVPEKCFLVSKLNPTIPRLWEIVKTPKNSVCSTEFQICKTFKNSDYPFVLCILKTQAFWETLQSATSGTSSSHQRVHTEDIFGYKTVIPTNNIRNLLNARIQAFLNKIQENNATIKICTEQKRLLIKKLF
jgi:type I restriction enzyme S subunit